MNTQKTIFNKLFSNNSKVEKKHNFKRNHKVSLSLMDEAREHLDNANGIDIMLDKFWEAVDVVRNADAYFFHEFRLEFDSAELIISETKEKLSELGVESTPELNELSQSLEYLREKGNELRENLDWLKGQIGGYDKI